MAKLDPKIIKQLNWNQVLVGAGAVGLKNVDKVSKEQLILTFVEEVEKKVNEGAELVNEIVAPYNDIITKFGWDQPAPEGGETVVGEGVETPIAVTEQPAISTPAPTPPVPAPTPIRTGDPLAKPVPRPSAAAPPPTPKKEKAPPKPRKETYSRWMAAGGAFQEVGSRENKVSTVDEFIKLSDEVYVNHGGKSNEHESAFIAKATLATLSTMGVVIFSNKETFSVKLG